MARQEKARRQIGAVSVVPILPVWVALPVAAAAGAMLNGAFPGLGWWPCAFAGIFLLLWTLLGRGFLTSVLVGFVTAATFWGSLVVWLTLYLGPLPWLVLTALESFFYAIAIACIARVLHRLPQIWPSVVGRLGIVPIVIGGLWSACESLTSVWPYGGFGWARIALSQSESPFAQLSTWFGISGLSFIVVWIVALLFQLLREPGMSVSPRVLIAIGAIAATLAFPAWPTMANRYVRVAAVQGNSTGGVFTGYKPGENLAHHIAATEALIGHDVDMVVWPENSSDTDPFRNPEAAQALDAISRRMDAPIIVGTVIRQNGQYFNTSLLWRAGEGAVERYDKTHPVPFGEYMPSREFFHVFAPNLVDLVSQDYTFGTRKNAYPVNDVMVGLAICFEISDDQLIDDMIANGAEIILAQTNNADFGRTDESAHQLAIARTRAIETGRSVVNISTVGTSAIIAPDGTTIDQLQPFEAGAMISDVPLSDSLTPAALFGRQLEWLLAGIGLAGFICCFVAAPERRRKNVR